MEVRRWEGRRRLRFLLAGLAVAILSVGAWLAVRSPLLDLDTVRVEGATRTSSAAIAEAAGLMPGLAMLDLDETLVRQRIEALPWVAEAEVDRRWPGTVTVTVTERTALVTTQDEAGAWWLLDRSGRVLERTDAQPPGLVAVAGLQVGGGPGSRTARADGALEVVAGLSPELAGRVSTVGVTETGEIHVTLNPEGTVRLGPPVDIDAKLRTVETVLASVDLRDLAVLDVRLPASPVLTRQ
jgi:cell division protein FtsQ